MLRETTPSSMAASRFKYKTYQLRWREFSSAQWLWYWLLVHEVTGSNPARTFGIGHGVIYPIQRPKSGLSAL